MLISEFVSPRRASLSNRTRPRLLTEIIDPQGKRGSFFVAFWFAKASVCDLGVDLLIEYP